MFARSSNDFIDALYYMSSMVPTELRMKLMPSVPVGSGMDCQKGAVVLQSTARRQQY